MPVPSGSCCKALTKTGQPCKAPPTVGGLCYFHANPEQARVLGQKGGRKNRYQGTDLVVPENLTLAGLGEILDQSLAELLAGRLQPRVATALAQLVNTRRRLSATIHLEARIAELERKLTDLMCAQGMEDTAPMEEPGPALWSRPGSGNGEGGDGGGDNGRV